ncbi:lytic transglycosylase domain-containing protein [Patescibacteria group bacterium]|nr:lytic transglycosylase domain-containing protein [Patescibacteria group bacterium]
MKNKDKSMLAMVLAVGALSLAAPFGSSGLYDSKKNSGLEEKVLETKVTSPVLTDTLKEYSIQNGKDGNDGKEKNSQYKPDPKRMVALSKEYNPLGIHYGTIEFIESGGNASAYNRSSRGTGLYQTIPQAVEDWNNFHPHKRYTMEDMKDPNKNREVGRWLLDKRMPQILRSNDVQVTKETVLIAYNWGPGNVSRLNRKMGGVLDEYGNLKEAAIQKLPSETRNYLKKYERNFKGS